MNAGRDVERLIAGWLTEEAPGRAPDRLLESTADVIDRTKQRRFLAAWREPMTISLRGLALAAALILVVAVGAAWVGRSTASVGNGPQSPSPGPSLALTQNPDAAIEGSWKVSFTHEEMIAAVLVDALEDDPANWGTFVLTLRDGHSTLVQQDLFGYVGSGTYTVDGSTITLKPSDEPAATFVMPFTITGPTLTFGEGGPVTFRVKPWVRIGP